MLDPDLLKLLICPLSRCPLIQDGEYLISTDAQTRRRYRIVDGIPDMLIEDSEEMDQESWQEIINKHR
ncbi:hypothetical protein KKG66_00635 [bacterium]|nr:hypothetical protein [bacterium]RQV96858.1 MAG: hypothetical protein EH220_05210 [bacterium]